MSGFFGAEKSNSSNTSCSHSRFHSSCRVTSEDVEVWGSPECESKVVEQSLPGRDRTNGGSCLRPCCVWDTAAGTGSPLSEEYTVLKDISEL
uniref:Uncharacterized protein n=1 Tax=Knipowitschia caucasica TaxID=637954 RepID=A0AAV2MQ79_KNICA